jgi:type III pantothenate kinase
MNIAVDIGNTKTKLALHDGNFMRKPTTLAGKPNQKLLAQLRASDLKRGIISTVGDSAIHWQRLLPDVDWLMLDQHTPVNFENRYATPATLGLDRIALAAAAANAFPARNTLVIDAGTCVTYDFIDQLNHYRGGSISPGLTMRLQAMAAFTARLPEVDLKPDVPLLGDSTASSLQSGALHGLAAEIDGMIKRYQEQFADLQTVVTGGDAKTLVPVIKSNIFARPNFLLEGLHGILAFNTP